MSKCCANCIYGRLICNEDKKDEYVGCIQFRGSGRDILLKELENSKYVSPIPDIVFTGWIFFYIPFGACRDDYDTVDAGIIANECLISPKEAHCNRFVARYVDEVDEKP